MSRIRRTDFKKLVAAGVAGAFLTATAGCYGPFNLTKNVYQWNSGVKGSGEINDKWMREAVFFGMIVVPVYMFSALLDAFVFNSIQFWTGNNPVKADTGYGNNGETVAQLGETTVRWAHTGDKVAVVYERKGVVQRRATILATRNGYRLADDQNVTLAEAVHGSDGSIVLLDQGGHVVQRWTAQQFTMAAAR